MTKLVSSVNQKGGVGKTTLCVQSAYRAAERKKRVLLIDIDPQENSTKYWLNSGELEGDLPPEANSINLFVDGAVIKPMPVSSVNIGAKTYYEGQIDIMYARETDLTMIEQADDSQQVLMNALSQSAQIRELGYDYVFIDCPPAVCLKQVSSVMISDDVITPMELDGFSAEGILKIHNIIIAAQQQWGDENKPQWHILANKVHAQSSASSSLLSGVREQLGSYMLEGFITTSSVVNDAMMNHRPIFKLPPNGNAAAVGRKFGIVLDEIFERIEAA
ncbi:ParA family protein [Vibrio parahaemolyticus]|uniref:ParA family protein n=1 Tax=Vibrio harveyi group TaxID=717610 RepID=UPI0003ED94AD|nr:ParA family protein [Vibrio parahaemolyticus]AHJ02729.1 Chromosome (plasmid) partitioning protein ParA [Vibrio parahaemolyticus UCM-V493]EGQ8679243.1 AAA family ATPase [Vibrio parahaemolyticus]EGQ8753660.1 AAA family ATPase [Vibrio parahaemolyticus]EGQ8757475.1 AAA family ATPase [Vibrio parahaemolyticus]EGQ8771760.1 AAA family ATPase [Vibrio parahaemolyticus]